MIRIDFRQPDGCRCRRPCCRCDSLEVRQTSLARLLRNLAAAPATRSRRRRSAWLIPAVLISQLTCNPVPCDLPLSLSLSHSHFRFSPPAQTRDPNSSRATRRLTRGSRRARPSLEAPQSPARVVAVAGSVCCFSKQADEGDTWPGQAKQTATISVAGSCRHSPAAPSVRRALVYFVIAASVVDADVCCCCCRRRRRRRRRLCCY